MKALTTSEFNEMFLNATDKLNIGFRTTFGGDALVAYKNGYMRLIEANDGKSRLHYHHVASETLQWLVMYNKFKAFQKKEFVEFVKTREYEVAVAVGNYGEYRFLQEVGADEMSAKAHGFNVNEIVSRTKVDIF